MEDVAVRPMRRDDAEAILAIYQAGLDSGDASFETMAPAWREFDAGRLPEHRYVASLALHARMGFRVVGTRERVGRQRGRWRDVVLLERRSPAII
ncbi:GNAT family N-acetyltransferase [Salinispora oceanensis]|uniref:GNAT family N-acetyltransferase n=1 Tax=Salinispora oceanensis TaxID=1050199 RepID=UPI000489DB58|nr:hypothetical protein [Salinispora oceanensis]